jgi:two-component system OmpR family sensor kinase
VKLHPHSLRWRLTLWYSLVLTAMLAVFAAGTWFLVRRVMAERADRFLIEARDAFVTELHAEGAALPDVADASRAAMRDIRFSDIEFVVLDSADRVIAASAPLVRHAAPMAPLPELDPPRLLERLDRLRTRPEQHATRRAPSRLTTVPGPDAPVRVALASTVLARQPLVVIAAQSRRWLQETLTAVALAFLAAIPAVLLVAGGGGYLLARRALAPVAAMGRQARSIEATNLHERLPVDEPRGELGELARVVNDLLGRLEDAFAQQRRFVADASHELRTPVAVLRAEADIALAQPARSEAEYREALGIIQGAGQRLSRIVNDLFLLARADSGPVPIRHESLFLDELVADTALALRAPAALRGVQVDIAQLPETPLRGDPDLLGRLVLNLLENAVKYSPAGSTVRLRLERSATSAVLHVADEGPGILPEHRERVFERFFRAGVDAAGEPAPAGAGLGLAIAKWVAEAHGGSIALVRSSGEGTEFRVCLPTGDVTSAPASP